MLSVHRGRAVTAEESDVVRGNSKWNGSVAGLGGLTGPVGIILCIFLL